MGLSGKVRSCSAAPRNRDCNFRLSERSKGGNLITRMSLWTSQGPVPVATREG
jgi:hypothetical protein